MANPQKENGYTAIANEILEQILWVKDLTITELKVLLYVLRKTYGYQKKEDQISLSQFQKGVLANRSLVCKTIKKLVSKRILLKQESVYKFNKNWEEWVVSRQTLVSKQTMGSVQADNRVVSSQTHTKETVTKENIQKKNNANALQANAWGNPEINEVMEFLKAQLGGTPDGTIALNRRYAKFLLDRMKKDYPEKSPVEQVKALIRFGSQDKFHGKNITSFEYLYRNAQKIILSLKSEINQETKGIKL